VLNAPIFVNGVDEIGRQIVESVFLSAGPCDFDRLHYHIGTQTEMQAQIAL
jgi:hypothetical protein